MCSHFCVVHGCFHLIIAEMRIVTETVWPTKPKIFIVHPLQALYPVTDLKPLNPTFPISYLFIGCRRVSFFFLFFFINMVSSLLLTPRVYLHSGLQQVLSPTTSVQDAAASIATFCSHMVTFSLSTILVFNWYGLSHFFLQAFFGLISTYPPNLIGQYGVLVL